MSAYTIVIYVICWAYMIMDFKHDIQMFQQNSYRTSRFLKWVKPHIGSAWRLTDVACIFLLLATQLLDFRLSMLLVALVCLGKTAMILKRKSKKPLVFTKRVWRLYSFAALLTTGGAVATAVCTYDLWWGTYPGTAITMSAMLLICVFSWLVILICHWMLAPVEKGIQRRYINDAKRILAGMPELKVIGITGSYGKTSTKHYLNHILGEKYDVLMTPGSYNTPMGVVRTVRELLKPYNEIFICEMGAKQKGDIKEICDIVHPGYGIITAVGPMHLESFHTIGNVCSTKFELADALPSDGTVAVNNDFAPCAEREVATTGVIRYGITNPEGCDYIATDIDYSASGTHFRVEGPDGLDISLTTPLLGEANISDILGAVVIALRLGVGTKEIQYAVSTLEQVEHRLSMRRTPGGVTVIDDAFNSNPVGSKMAVDVLSHFKGGKRIIVTPGMIELGTEQETLNRELGRQIGNKLDVAVVVGSYNRQPLLEGIKESGTSIKVVEADTFNDAQRMLGGILEPGDTVLYENDLPDTFK